MQGHRDTVIGCTLHSVYISYLPTYIEARLITFLVLISVSCLKFVVMVEFG